MHGPLDNDICNGLVQLTSVVMVSVLASYVSSFLFVCVTLTLTLILNPNPCLLVHIIGYLSHDRFNQLCPTKGKIATTFAS